MSTIHPYVGITRIRYEGIISARTSEHPLIISAAKVRKNPRTAKRFRDYFTFYLLLFYPFTFILYPYEPQRH